MLRGKSEFTGSLQALDAQKGFWAKLGNEAHDGPDLPADSANAPYIV